LDKDGSVSGVYGSRKKGWAGTAHRSADRERARPEVESLLQLGFEVGFCRFEFAPGLAILEGEAAWRVFAERAPDDAFTMAMQRLLSQ
jgi:hypothetical protein